MTDFFALIEQVTEQWKLANGLQEGEGRLAGSSMMRSNTGLGSKDDSDIDRMLETAKTVGIDRQDQLTFADIELGDEFYDEWDNLWEKRSERHAISWIQYSDPEWGDFKPDDKVRIK